MDSRCECCGGALGPTPVGLRYRGRDSIFCSFGCAVVQAAPACGSCAAKVLGRGFVAGPVVYCSLPCRDAAGARP